MRGKYCKKNEGACKMLKILPFTEVFGFAIWVGTGQGVMRGFVMGKFAGYQEIRGGPCSHRPRSSVNLNHYTRAVLFYSSSFILSPVGPFD